MGYVLFVVTGMIATVLGYSLGWALHRKEQSDDEDTPVMRLAILLCVVGIALTMTSGVIHLLSELALIRLPVALFLALASFHYSHPQSVRRIQSLLIMTEDIGLTALDIWCDRSGTRRKSEDRPPLISPDNGTS